MNFEFYDGGAHYYIYVMWSNMRRRCIDPDSTSYDRYGARGIRMYELWLEDHQAFAMWLLTTLGPKPDGMSLDRIDNDGHYEPNNLKWSTISDQNKNRRLQLGKSMEDRHIYRNNARNMWVVSVYRKYIGTYKDIADARKARDRALHVRY